MNEKKTPCECPLAGYCNRHKMNKNPHFHHLCQTNNRYFEMWEQCRGPMQEFTDCAKTSNTREPVKLPEKKKPCLSCQTNISTEEHQQELKENLPSLWQQAKNLAGSVAEHISNGAKKSPEELKAERLSICNNCEFYIKDQSRCGKCGCFMLTKAGWESAKCPIGKW